MVQTIENNVAVTTAAAAAVPTIAKLSLKPFRRAAVPILAISTADPAGIVRLAVRDAQNGATAPVLLWDCIHGITAGNEQAREIADLINGGQPPAIATGNPIEALSKLEVLGARDEKTITVMLGLADILADQTAGPPARQALWNLRDILPAAGALLVLAVPMGWRNPFPNDIAMAEDPLPAAEELRATAAEVCEQAGAPAPDDATAGKCADALLGLSSFAAVQALALSISKRGIDTGGLWARKRKQVAQTSGLSIYAGRERFADLGGVENAKALFGRILAGNRKPGAIVFIDEIEKAMAGAGGAGGADTSGTSQALLGYMLSYMQDTAATGAIFLGHPGAAKSALAKAVGNEGDIPTVQLDLGAIKGGIVGSSESNMREALAVVTAVSAGRPLFIATCNGIANLPPELRRRFSLGTLFFDLPTDDERAKIWPIYLKRFNLPAQPLPAADNWTGAEIQACADLADRLACPLIEAAKFVVPGWTSARESIEARRREANGRYLSAGAPGVYRAPVAGAPAGGARRIDA